MFMNRKKQDDNWSDHKIVDSNGCWIYATVGKSNNKNYASIAINGKLISLHRLSYQTYVGNIPVNKWVLHKCNNRRCFNPEHLYLGSPRDNAQDLVNSGIHSQARKTHCVNGHEFTLENTHIRMDSRRAGTRECRKCDAIRHMEKKHGKQI